MVSCSVVFHFLVMELGNIGFSVLFIPTSILNSSSFDCFIVKVLCESGSIFFTRGILIVVGLRVKALGLVRPISM